MPTAKSEVLASLDSNRDVTYLSDHESDDGEPASDEESEAQLIEGGSTGTSEGSDGWKSDWRREE